MQIKVAISDDHLLVINGIKTMLAPYSHISIVYDTTDPTGLIPALADIQPHVLLLDIQMPAIDGMELCRQVHKLYPDIKVIAISSFTDTRYIKQMLRNGAAGYLLKNTDPVTLLSAIEKVHEGEQFLDEALKQDLLNEALTGNKRSVYEIPLTRREKEILKLIAEEHSNQEIADLLYISLRTVETHRLNLTQKQAIRRGLLD